MIRFLLRTWMLGLALCTGVAWAQQEAQDLVFPTEASTFSMFSRPQMALYKPEGAGPFPALVLLHQCGGLGSRTPNQSMLTWAKEAVAQGYVALVIDSLGPRGVDTVCMGPKGGVTFSRGAKDALQAAAHLRTLPYVIGARVGLAGYSWGAMVGLFSASPSALPSQTTPRFAAIVSFYPGCFTLKPANGAAPYELVRPDIDRPLLVLMGALDNETPAEDCIQKLEPLQGKGAPITLHTYPDTTHCWDCKQLDGFSKTDFRGNRVTYHYSDDVTTDSRKRMFDFLAKAMPAP
jgi:dienelactone hydrolase